MFAMNKKTGWQGVALKKDFIQMVQQHLKGNPRYHSMADFIRQATLEKIDKDNGGINY